MNKIINKGLLLYGLRPISKFFCNCKLIPYQPSKLSQFLIIREIPAMPAKVNSWTGGKDELQKRLQDYERLHSILQIICSSLRVEDILQQTIRETAKLCKADQAAILLFEPEDNALAQTLVRQQASSQPLLDHTLNSILAGWVSRHKRPLLTDNLIATLGKTAVAKKYQAIGSVIAMPLMLRGKPVGVINCITTSASPPLGNRELHLLQLLAPLCAQFLANARLHEQLFREANRLRKDVQERYTFHGMIGRSEKMQRVFALLERVIPTEGRVLLEGESGTGKELIARIIHYNGPRKDRPLVAVDCGALPASLLESELFGHVKGAFTGAIHDKKGLFEEAHGGSLFLDEIVNMPVEIQAKFLRAIQENEIRPVGSTRPRKIDVRIIAAASGNLREHVQAGTFRQDLYFRLNVVSILLPPLR
ncbi:MAG: GAF domain-containing protein, partial [Calditrichaeota bacterium]